MNGIPLKSEVGERRISWRFPPFVSRETLRESRLYYLLSTRLTTCRREEREDATLMAIVFIVHHSFSPLTHREHQKLEIRTIKIDETLLAPPPFKGVLYNVTSSNNNLYCPLLLHDVLLEWRHSCGGITFFRSPERFLLS